MEHENPIAKKIEEILKTARQIEDINKDQSDNRIMIDKKTNGGFN